MKTKIFKRDLVSFLEELKKVVGRYIYMYVVNIPLYTPLSPCNSRAEY